MLATTVTTPFVTTTDIVARKGNGAEISLNLYEAPGVVQPPVFVSARNPEVAVVTARPPFPERPTRIVRTIDPFPRFPVEMDR